MNTNNIAQINDGNRPFGSRVLSVFRPGGATFTGKTKTFTLTNPTKFSGVVSTDGTPLASISVKDFQTGSGQWQVVKDGDGNEIRLNPGDCFTETLEGVQINFYVDTAEKANETEGEIKMQAFTFRPVLDPTNFSVSVAGVQTPVNFPIA